MPFLPAEAQIRKASRFESSLTQVRALSTGQVSHLIVPQTSLCFFLTPGYSASKARSIGFFLISLCVSEKTRFILSWSCSSHHNLRVAYLKLYNSHTSKVASCWAGCTTKKCKLAANGWFKSLATKKAWRAQFNSRARFRASFGDFWARASEQGLSIMKGLSMSMRASW